MTDDIVKRLTRATEGKFDGMLLDLLPEAADEIKRLRAAITAWADAWDAADRGEERDDGVGVYKYAERQEMELRKAVGR